MKAKPTLTLLPFSGMVNGILLQRFMILFKCQTILWTADGSMKQYYSDLDGIPITAASARSWAAQSTFFPVCYSVSKSSQATQRQGLPLFDHLFLFRSLGSKLQKAGTVQFDELPHQAAAGQQAGIAPCHQSP